MFSRIKEIWKEFGEDINSKGIPHKMVFISYAKDKTKRKWKYKTDYYTTTDEAIAAAFEDGATEVHFGNL